MCMKSQSHGVRSAWNEMSVEWYPHKMKSSSGTWVSRVTVVTQVHVSWSRERVSNEIRVSEVVVLIQVCVEAGSECHKHESVVSLYSRMCVLKPGISVQWNRPLLTFQDYLGKIYEVWMPIEEVTYCFFKALKTCAEWIYVTCTNIKWWVCGKDINPQIVLGVTCDYLNKMFLCGMYKSFWREKSVIGNNFGWIGFLCSFYYLPTLSFKYLFDMEITELNNLNLQMCLRHEKKNIKMQRET